MISRLSLVCAVVTIALLELYRSTGAVAAATYHPQVTGNVAGFRLAGIEPDGDPLDQVVLKTRLSASAGAPPLTLIIDSYLENFKPDTTPILPDLLHPNKTAQNLGGFLQGKALMTDDAGNVLYIGSFLAEAFLNNSNHAVMQLTGTNAAYGGRVVLKGIFSLAKDGSMSGALTGLIRLPSRARAQVRAQAGAAMKPLKKIIGVVTVRPAPMVGRATSGTSSAPLKTNYGPTPTPIPSQVDVNSGAGSRRVPTVTLVAGVGAIACLLIGVYLFWTDRRRSRTSPEETSSG